MTTEPQRWIVVVDWQRFQHYKGPMAAMDQELLRAPARSGVP
ncbi:MAG: hypothetical protein M5T61_19120 [Acidimicrobiia bacterium]|nr:hypothetical protein [Acidimicrobiia bacterium]